MEPSLVTIIVPTYKRPDYLKLTLQSILAQTYENIEVIVVDDGSPGNENLLLCKKFDKIRYIKIENSGGPAKPRNVGIKKAKGEFIAFVDDDDIWLPEKIEKQVKIFENNPEFGLVHGPCQVIDEKGNITETIIGRPGSPKVKHGDVKMRMMGNWTIMMPTPLVRKTVLEKVGFFNESIPPATEDREFWTRFSFYTLFYYLNEPLVFYRKHIGGISENKKVYLDSPLILKNVLKNKMEERLINKKEFKQLISNLVQMQLKMLKLGYGKTVQNLFNLDIFWFFKIAHLKLLSFIIFKR